jgi:hypothetical protein
MLLVRAEPERPIYSNSSRAENTSTYTILRHPVRLLTRLIRLELVFPCKSLFSAVLLSLPSSRCPFAYSILLAQQAPTKPPYINPGPHSCSSSTRRRRPIPRKASSTTTTATYGGRKVVLELHYPSIIQ